MPYKDKEKQKAYTKAYQPKWNKENSKGFYLRLNKSKDADIIKRLCACDNQQRYIKELIRADIMADNSID